MKSNFVGHRNGLKTVALFGVMWVLLLLVGGGLAVATRNSLFILLFTGVGIVQTFYVYWNSDKMALRSMNAYPVSEEEAPDLYGIVRELSERANQPMPRIYIAPTSTPNAFATGRNPEHAAVCCTEGILNLLDRREIRGVLGHELMHVYNRDILTSSVASAIGGLISAAAQYAMLYGRSDRNSGYAQVIGSFLAALAAPFVAMLVQLAISRTREYDADEDGSILTGDPLALASALRKLEAGISSVPMPVTPKGKTVASLMIANPFGAHLGNLMSTHPPMDQRIARLESMAQDM